MRYVIFLIVVGFTGTVFADDYLSARIAAAISLSRSASVVRSASSGVELPSRSMNIPKIKRVRYYWAPWCKYCPAVELGLNSRTNLAFEVVKINVDVSGYPAGFNTIPHLEWENASGKRVYLETWAGLDDFLRRWQYSQTVPARVTKAPAKVTYGPQNRYPSFSGYYPHWTYPGNLKEHLKSAHGVYEADQLTYSQAAKLHDTMHETGYSANQIRRYYLKK
jgi:hypothetical protein